MNGRITFGSLEELAVFLAEFTKSGNTATFEIKSRGGDWIMIFTGGN